METRLVMILPFNDPSWDPVLESWLQDQLDKETRKHLSARLSVDAKFREDFCEWVKALRSPGWQAEAQRGGISS